MIEDTQAWFENSKHVCDMMITIAIAPLVVECVIRALTITDLDRVARR